MTQKPFSMYIEVFKEIKLDKQHRNNITKIINDFNLTDITIKESSLNFITYKSTCDFSKTGTQMISTSSNDMLVGTLMITVYLQHHFGLFANAILKFISDNEDILGSARIDTFSTYFHHRFGFRLKNVLLLGRSQNNKYTYFPVSEDIYENRHLYSWDNFNVDIFKFNLSTEKLKIFSQYNDTSILSKDRMQIRNLYSLSKEDFDYLKENEAKYIETKEYLNRSLNIISNPSEKSLISKAEIDFLFKKELETQKVLLMKESLEYFYQKYNVKINRDITISIIKNMEFSSELIASTIFEITNGVPPQNSSAIHESIIHYVNEIFEANPVTIDTWNNIISFFNVFDVNKKMCDDTYNNNYLKSIFTSLQEIENTTLKNDRSYVSNELNQIYKQCGKEKLVTDFHKSFHIEHTHISKMEFYPNGKITLFFISTPCFREYKDTFLNPAKKDS